MADDRGWNSISFHGSNPIPTFIINRLATESVQYSMNSLCNPTLMTGMSAVHHRIQTPLRHGDYSSGQNLPCTLLPELKLRYNDTNYMVKKTKNKNYFPSSHGFDKYHGFYLGSTDYWRHPRNFSNFYFRLRRLQSTV